MTQSPQSKWIQKKRQEMASISILIPKPLKEQLDQCVKSSSETRQAWIIKAIEEKINKPQHRYAIPAVLVLLPILMIGAHFNHHKETKTDIQKAPIALFLDNQKIIQLQYSQNMNAEVDLKTEKINTKTDIETVSEQEKPPSYEIIKISSLNQDNIKISVTGPDKTINFESIVPYGPYIHTSSDFFMNNAQHHIDLLIGK